MGSHRNPQSLLARYRRWRRYRGYYAAILADARPQLKARAWDVLRQVEEQEGDPR